MLREAGLSETTRKGIPKERCVYVARKRGNDEIAPSEELFGDFEARRKELENEFGKRSDQAHNRAFLECGYERRFTESILANPKAMEKLGKISERSKTEEVYLVCYEGASKACHRRILLRIAERFFSAQVVVEGIEPARTGGLS